MEEQLPRPKVLRIVQLPGSPQTEMSCGAYRGASEKLLTLRKLGQGEADSYSRQARYNPAATQRPKRNLAAD
jgi:hypothetical protein